MVLLWLGMMTQEACNLVLETKNTNVALSKVAYSRLVEGLLKAGLQEDAVTVESIAKSHFSDFSMKNISSNLLLAEQVRRDCLKDAVVTAEEILRSGVLPSQSALKTLTEALALAGDVESLEKLQALSSGLKSTYFTKSRHYFNAKLLAYFRNGNFEEATSMLQSQYTEGDRLDQSVDYLISRLMSNDMSEALEKVSIVAEKLANQFAVYRPATELFVRYVKSGREEEATQLLQRCNSIMEQRGLLRRKISLLIKSEQEDCVSRLVDLLSDPFYKQTAYNLQLKHYADANDEENAMALYEKMKAEQIQQEDHSLRRLASLLRRSGKPIPFTEPQAPVQSTDDEELSNASSPPEDKH
ncbi:leucine-rich PPR motif-containing protein, mitochondrial-like [Hyperolius riggenbachi]|uniref:leucine-rich PPR motif-containing protein, mitochondrial-like n=1 Tax=Hyperolius riggenbachi TaxID=752182 RepID=UPI0035A2DD1C